LKNLESDDNLLKNIKIEFNHLGTVQISCVDPKNYTVCNAYRTSAVTLLSNTKRYNFENEKAITTCVTQWIINTSMPTMISFKS
jgi:hypothetical protein